MRRESDYLDLVTPYHRGKPNFSAILEALGESVVAARDVIAHLPEDFDLDEAIGAQLDVVGKWLGRSRDIPTPLPDPWFAFDMPLRGWDRGIWKGPYALGSSLVSLDDETYRKLLYAKRAANNWDGTRAGAEAAFRLLISNVTHLLWLQDGFDMSDSVCIAQTLPDLLYLFLLEQNLIPVKSAGVKRYYLFTSVIGSPLFGFDCQNSRVSGWDEGAWGVTASYLLNNPAEIPSIPLPP